MGRMDTRSFIHERSGIRIMGSNQLPSEDDVVTDKTPEISCKDCVWCKTTYVRAFEGGSTGTNKRAFAEHECRRYPPAYRQPNTTAEYVMVSEDHWCGEHAKVRQSTDETAITRDMIDAPSISLG